MNKYKRNCPICKKELSYSTQYSAKYAEQRNSKCYSCNMKGNIPWNSGKKMDENFRKKVLNGIKKKYESGWSPRLGTLHSKKSKEKMAKSHIGKSMSKKTKEKLSKLNKGEKNKFYGKHHTEEMKLKRRIQIMERLLKLGIPNNEDKGAKEFFEKYNKEHLSNFIPTRFLKIGYFADGYDKNLHEWIEYDTPMHNNLKQKLKDKIRQNNIINYFKSINNPLNKFIRFEVNDKRKIIDITHVL